MGNAGDSRKRRDKQVYRLFCTGRYARGHLVAHSNFQQKVDIISTLCEQLLPEYPKLASYKSVVAKIVAAQKARNKYAHHPVVTNEETGQVNISYASARGTLKTTTEVVAVSQIKQATAKIHEAMCALHTLVTNRPLKPFWEREG